MTPIRAIIFDLDDTLYPERSFVASGFRAVARWAAATFGVHESVTCDRLLELARTGPKGRTFNIWAEENELPGSVARDAVDVYQAHAPQIRAFTEIPGILDRLHRKYKLGLLSDGWAAVQRRKFGALGIAEHFDGVIFTDELGREFWKPSPQGFYRLAEVLATSPAQMVYVADNAVKDYLAARRAGARSIRFSCEDAVYGHETPESLDHAPDVTIESLDQLEEAIADLSRQ